MNPIHRLVNGFFALIFVSGMFLPASYALQNGKTDACEASDDMFNVSTDKLFYDVGETVEITVSTTFTGSKDSTIAYMLVMDGTVQPHFPPGEINKNEIFSGRSNAPFTKTMTGTLTAARNQWHIARFHYSAPDGSWCEKGINVWAYNLPFFK